LSLGRADEDDPFYLSRVRALNFLKRAAKRTVDAAGSARTIWLQSFSHEAVQNWQPTIDFLLIDGNHQLEAVERDWIEWSPFIAESGEVAFHDARRFPRRLDHRRLWSGALC